MSKWTKFRDTVLKPTAGAVAGFLVGGPVGLAIGAYAGLQMNEAHAQQQANKANLRIQQQALAQQTAEERIIFSYDHQFQCKKILRPFHKDRRTNITIMQ